jgi:malate dehydrogenase (oxaloacetate-decarboxylating)
MKLAAAEAIAMAVASDELGPGFIIPSVFDKRVVELVAPAVAEAARAAGMTRNHA